MAEELDMQGRTEVRDGMKITWNAGIPMRDGNVLRCDIYRPDDDEPHPVILTISSYTKGENVVERLTKLEAMNGSDYGFWNRMVARTPSVVEGTSTKHMTIETPDPEKWVPDGYALVRVDARGAGWSPGMLDSLSINEAKDTYDAIEWAAQQPWCTGKVGMLGISYYAVTQWFAAAQQPPHLAAILPWEGFSNYYREPGLKGGIMSDFQARWSMGQTMTQYGVGDKWGKNPNTGESLSAPGIPPDELPNNMVNHTKAAMTHKLDDEFWAEHTPDLSKINIPIFTVGNWSNNLHLRGSVAGYTDAPSKEKWIQFLSGPSSQTRLNQYMI